MRSDAPALMPIFRSQWQAELLALLFLSPDTELTLTDLAARLGATAGAVHAEVHRLIKAGLLTDRFVRRSRLISANSGARATRALSELLLLLLLLLLLRFGPERVVAEEFADVGSVEQVAIYGSWACRRRGPNHR